MLALLEMTPVKGDAEDASRMEEVDLIPETIIITSYKSLYHITCADKSKYLDPSPNCDTCTRV